MKPSREQLRLVTENFGERRDIELMLRVIRGEAAEAAQAYADWRATTRIDDMDVHVMRLVPRLVARTTELSIRDDETEHLRGIARYLWVKTEVMVEGAREASLFLARAGIKTLAMKGVALIRRGILSKGARPLTDADLVLRDGNDAVKANAVLRGRGFRPTLENPHATTFRRGEAEIDLHTCPVPVDLWFDAWKEADLTDTENLDQGPSYAVTAPTTALLLALLHARSDTTGSAWIFDAEALVAQGGIDWKRVVDYARARIFVLTFASMLRRVRGVPEGVVAELDATRASPIEALELRLLSAPNRRHGIDATKALRTLRLHPGAIDLTKLETQRLAFFDERWIKEWR